MERGGPAIDYLYRHKTDKDYFVCGHSGAGYIHPTQLDEPRPNGYPSIMEQWQAYCRKYYRIMDYSITGWILNLGSPEDFTPAYHHIYTTIGGDGLGYDDIPQTIEPALQDGAPTIRRSYPDFLRYNRSDSITLSELGGLDPDTEVPIFRWWRTILVYPDVFRRLQHEIDTAGYDTYKMVDAYTFYYLLRYHLCGENVCHAAWVADDIPTIVEPATAVDCTVSARNDAWDVWNRDDDYRLVYAIVPQGQRPARDDYVMDKADFVDAGSAIETGQSYDFTLHVDMPSQAGVYDLYYDMCRTLTVLENDPLLSNGSFSAGFDDWRHFAVNGGAEACSISSDAYDGDGQAARLKVTTVTPTSDQGLDRDGPATPKVTGQLGGTYRVSFAAKNLGGTDRRLMLSVAEYDFNNTWLAIQGDETFAPNADYTTFMYEYQVQSPDTAMLNIAFRIVDSQGSMVTGDMLVDAVEVIDVDSPPSAETVVQFFADTGIMPWKTTIRVVDDVHSVDTDGDGLPDVVEKQNGMLEWHPDDSAACGDLGMWPADICGPNATADCYVNLYDFTAMAGQWGQQLPTDADLDQDGAVDIADLAILAAEWLECLDPADPNCLDWLQI